MSTDIAQPGSDNSSPDNTNDLMEKGVKSPQKWLLFYAGIMAFFAYLSTQHVEGESSDFIACCRHFLFWRSLL